MDKEKLILAIMKECEEDGEPISRVDAEEMAEMEIKAKGVKHYEQAEKKPRKAPTRKADTEKQFLVKAIADGFSKLVGIATHISNNERQIDFEYNGSCYSITLTKHRPKK